MVIGGLLVRGNLLMCSIWMIRYVCVCVRVCYICVRYYSKGIRSGCYSSVCVCVFSFRVLNERVRNLGIGKYIFLKVVILLLKRFDD